MRVLVSAASTHGGTAEIGRRIATTLRRFGLDVDVAQPEHITNLHRYDGFVLGSAIYRGRWQNEATDLLEQHREMVSSRPCWLFSSGPIDEGVPAQPLRSGAVEELLAVTGAREHRLFGGRIDLDRLSAPERWLARWVRVRSGDARPWPEIDVWATEIAADLISGATRLRMKEPDDA